MTPEDKAKAQQIVESWFWQPDSFRSRQFTRFYESAPMQSDVLRLVIDYLKEQQTTDLTLLNRPFSPGETWQATDAWYQTMEGQKWAGTESTKIRVYQSLRPASDAEAGPFTVEDGCQYAVEHTFYWDVAALPTLPTSTSGEQYTMQGVVRDPKTNLYSCVVEHRSRVQQDVGEYETAKTIFESLSEEQHLGVKQDSVAETGQQASVGDGTLVERRIEKNPDCTSNVVNRTTVEEPVEEAVVEISRGIRDVVTKTTHRNQSAPLNATGLAVGETRRTEKTRGGLNDNIIVETEHRATPEEISRTCDRQTLEHTDISLVNRADDPDDSDSDSSDGHLVAEVNKVKQRQVRLMDGGSWDVETRETTYTPASKEKTWSDDSHDYKLVIYRNQPEPLVPLVSETWDSVSLSFSLNNHGSYDGSYSCRSGAAGSGGGGKIWSKTSTVSQKWYYQKAGGKIFTRTFGATRKDVYGAVNSVLDEVADGESCSIVGWISEVKSMRGTDFAFGVKFTGITIGPETEV